MKIPIALEPPPTQATTRVGQPALALEQLRARLVADHALQVAHERRVGRRADDRADHVVRALRRSSTQSRIAAEVASLSVRAPASTGCTLAPSSSIRCTLGRWRRVSSTPM